MWKRFYYVLLAMFLAFLAGTAMAQDEEDECELEDDSRGFTSEFADDCRFKTRYFRHETPNAYFPMEPGWQVVLEGEDEDEFIRVEVTVLNEIQVVAGVETRVIEEREFIDGELFEVSRNFFAICAQTNDIYYFGEDVDFYEDGEIVDHHGAWRVGVDGATPGILIPGTPLVGARYHQEVSPEIAEDRAEIMGFTELEIDDVVYENVLVLEEGSALDTPCDNALKYYAPGIGNIIDEELEIVEAGFVFRLSPHYPLKNQ